jgi:Uma2 family endonuclease
MSLDTLPRVTTSVDYPESDGEPMAETDLHLEEMIALIAILQNRFRDAPDVYVAGDNFIYYEEGNPDARFSPDVYVVFGVAKRLRRIYKLWEEGRAPAFVLEVSSRKTWPEDEGNKKAICARLGVAEYFLYDPEGDYLEPPLQGFRLAKRAYAPIQPDEQQAVTSQTLGLKFLLENGRLQAIDSASGERLLRPREAYAALREAEAELARLREELEQLRGSGQS